MPYDFILNVFLLIGGIALLIRSGLWAVGALTKLSQFLGVSEYSVSFILMAFATTLPEFFVGLSAASGGKPLLSLGNVFGSNIVNLGLILGLIVLASGGIKIKDAAARSDSWIIFALAALPAVLMLDLKLSRLEGFLLITAFFAYLGHLLRLKDVLEGKAKAFRLNGAVSVRVFFAQFGLFVVSAALLLLAAFLTIKGAKGISAALGASELIIGLFLLAIGTSLPEFFFGLRAALHHHEGLSVGNLLGAAVLNSTWVLGVTAVIAPIKMADGQAFLISAVAMVLLIFLVNLFVRTRLAISRGEGLVLLAIYAVFFAASLF